jgi:DNA-binding response OmpR family regulator
MDSKGKTVLIADDEPDILEIISYNLKMKVMKRLRPAMATMPFKNFRHKPDLVILT